MDDADLAGPLFFLLAFGVFLLLTGKVRISDRDGKKRRVMMTMTTSPLLMTHDMMVVEVGLSIHESKPPQPPPLLQVHFGYIYGFGVSGCGAMYLVLNLLSQHSIDIWRVCSILGYGLLPVIGLAFLGIAISLKSTLGQ